MSKPAITVLMPVFNGEKYLREAIESILQQTFTNFELLIINDGSTDKSEEIILSYDDKRIKYLKNEKNLRLIATLNKGFELATGKYVVRADADDINYLNRLQLQYDFMEQHPEVGLLGTGFETFGNDIETKVTQYAPDHNTICLKHLYQIHLSHGTSIFRMSVIKQHALLFDPAYEHAEDYELWTRISKVCKLANLQQMLYRVRQHNSKVSELYAQVQQQNSLRIKQNLFSALGATLSEKEIELYEKIAQHEYVNNKGFVEAAKNLLEKLVAANAQTTFFEKTFFEKSVGYFWFNVAYNCKQSLQQYFNSPLSNYRNLSIAEKLKFIIKSGFKI